MIEGAIPTVMLADAVPPLPPSFDVTAPVVLFCTPLDIPVTLTLNVHDELALRSAAVRLTLLDPASAVMAPPPQPPLCPLGDDITSPDGSVSVNPTPVSKPEKFGFVIVKVRVVLPSRVIEDAPKVAVMVGGATTVSVAVLLLPPAPVSLVEIGPVVFDKDPAVVAVTSTEIAQVALAASVAPDRVTVLAPVTALMVPPQVLATPLGVATTNPAGSASLNATPVRAWLALGLLMVKPNVDVPFMGIVDGPKVTVMLGDDSTLILADAVLPPAALKELTALVTLVKSPTSVAFTFTLNVHDPLAAMVAPVMVRVLEPAVAVMFPPVHDPVRAGGFASTIPAGNVSVNPTPVSAIVFAAGFVRVKLRLVVPFIGILEDPNDFVMDGGSNTIRLADAAPPAPPSVDDTAPVVLF